MVGFQYQVFVADYDGEMPLFLTENEASARAYAAGLTEIPSALAGLQSFLFNVRRGDFKLVYVLRWSDGLPGAVACYCRECQEAGRPEWLSLVERHPRAAEEYNGE